MKLPLKLSVAIVAVVMVSCCGGDGKGRRSRRVLDGSQGNSQRGLPTGLNPLPVKPLVQEGYSSCWSTSGEMIMLWASQVLSSPVRIRQCTQSNHALSTGTSPPGTDCCVGNKLLPGISPCDSDGLPDFYNWGFDKTQTQVPLSWGNAKKEIDQGQAFAFSRTPISPTGSLEASHMLVVVGYEIDGTDQKLVVLNPIFDKDAMMMTIDWEEYAGQAVGSTAWHNDENFFGIKVR